ncbi:MAG: hypothetical protein KDA42_07395 [Planctomycetales bacterium]|nr:hypothetical protein [Planctomycetales bacterium]
MNRHLRTTALAVLAATLMLIQGTSRAQAQSSVPPRWEEVDFESLYDASRVITVRGPITAFWHFPLGDRRTGVIVRLHVGGEFAHVYIGTKEFLDRNNLELSINDYVTVTGNKALLRFRGLVVVADSIKKGDQLLRLRNDAGRPLWP